MPRLHVSKTAEEKARFKESRRLSTAKWRQNKIEGRTKSANSNNSVSQTAQAHRDQSANRKSTNYQQKSDDKADDIAEDIADDIADNIADDIADDPSYASCEPPNSPYSIDEIIEMVRFCDVSDSNNSSDSDDIVLPEESLQASSNSETDLLGNI